MKLSYMMEVQRGDTVIYRYNPPADALAAGVVKRVMLGADYEAACVYVQEQNALMAEWRSERKYLRELTSKSKVSDLIKSYVASISFTKLSPKTQTDYTYYLKCWYSSKVAGVLLPQAKLCNIMTPMCQRVALRKKRHLASEVTSKITRSHQIGNISRHTTKRFLVCTGHKDQQRWHMNMT